MLIHRQNSYAPRGKQRTVRREAQSREPVNKVKELPVLTPIPSLLLLFKLVLYSVTVS
jgi:hypothetical protein